MYLLHGQLTAKPGHQEELTDILLEVSKLVSVVKGCKLYAIGKSEVDQNSVCVTELWENKEDHENSLKVEGVKELIVKAMSIVEGQPTMYQELKIVGGSGL